MTGLQDGMEYIFISYYPLKQGLKQPTVTKPTVPKPNLYPTIH